MILAQNKVNRAMRQNRGSEMDSYVYGYLTYDKRGAVVQQGKGSFSTTGFIAYRVTNRNKGNLTSILHPIHISSRWNTDQNVKD